MTTKAGKAKVERPPEPPKKTRQEIVDEEYIRAFGHKFGECPGDDTCPFYRGVHK